MQMRGKASNLHGICANTGSVLQVYWTVFFRITSKLCHSLGLNRKFYVLYRHDTRLRHVKMSPLPTEFLFQL